MCFRFRNGNCLNNKATPASCVQAKTCRLSYMLCCRPRVLDACAIATIPIRPGPSAPLPFTQGLIPFAPRAQEPPSLETLVRRFHAAVSRFQEEYALHHESIKSSRRVATTLLPRRPRDSEARDRVSISFCSSLSLPAHAEPRGGNALSAIK